MFDKITRNKARNYWFLYKKKKKVGLPELTKKIETISLKLISEGVTNEVDFATIGLWLQ